MDISIHVGLPKVRQLGPWDDLLLRSSSGFCKAKSWDWGSIGFVGKRHYSVNRDGASYCSKQTQDKNEYQNMTELDDDWRYPCFVLVRECVWVGTILLTQQEMSRCVSFGTLAQRLKVVRKSNTSHHLGGRSEPPASESVARGRTHKGRNRNTAEQMEL